MMDNNWQLLKLKEVCKKITDGSHNPPRGVDISDYLMLSSKNINHGYINYDQPRYLSEADFINENKRTNIQAGDVLLTIVGTIGRVAVVPKNHPNFTVQRSVAVLRVNEELVLPEYLMRVMQYKAQELIKLGRGVAQKGVYLEQINNFEIPIPNISEQRLIIERIDKCARLLDSRIKSIQKLDELFQSFFYETFGGLYSDKRGFDEKQLADVVEPGRIITYGIVQAGAHDPNGVPYIKTGDIVDNRIVEDGLSRTSKEIAKKYKRSEVNKGDIIMSIRATVGTVALLPDSLDGANLTQGTARISPSKIIEKSYLFYYLQTSDVQSWINKQVKGATFREITLKKLRELPVLLPPQDLQIMFSIISEKINTQKIAFEESKQHIENLYQSLVYESFNRQTKQYAN